MNGPKILDFNSELYNRISKSHIGHILTIGNQISIMFYGTVIKFEVKSVKTKESESDLKTSFEKMKVEDQDYKFFKINENTKWRLFK